MLKVVKVAVLSVIMMAGIHCGGNNPSSNTDDAVSPKIRVIGNWLDINSNDSNIKTLWRIKNDSLTNIRIRGDEQNGYCTIINAWGSAVITDSTLGFDDTDTNGNIMGSYVFLYSLKNDSLFLSQCQNSDCETISRCSKYDGLIPPPSFPAICTN